MFSLRLSPQGVERVDELRGSWSRSEYMRRAIAAAVKNGMAGPK